MNNKLVLMMLLATSGQLFGMENQSPTTATTTSATAETDENLSMKAFLKLTEENNEDSGSLRINQTTTEDLPENVAAQRQLREENRVRGEAGMVQVCLYNDSVHGNLIIQVKNHARKPLLPIFEAMVANLIEEGKKIGCDRSIWLASEDTATLLQVLEHTKKQGTLELNKQQTINLAEVCCQQYTQRINALTVRKKKESTHKRLPSAFMNPQNSTATKPTPTATTTTSVTTAPTKPLLMNKPIRARAEDRPVKAFPGQIYFGCANNNTESVSVPASWEDAKIKNSVFSPVSWKQKLLTACIPGYYPAIFARPTTCQSSNLSNTMQSSVLNLENFKNRLARIAYGKTAVFGALTYFASRLVLPRTNNHRGLLAFGASALCSAAAFAINNWRQNSMYKQLEGPYFQGIANTIKDERTKFPKNDKTETILTGLEFGKNSTEKAMVASIRQLVYKN